MTTLTETDIRKSKLPVLIEENGKHIIIVDMHVYEHLSPAEKEKYKTEWKKDILNIMEIYKDDPEIEKLVHPDKSKKVLDNFHLNTSMVLYPTENFSIMFLTDEFWFRPTRYLESQNKRYLPEDYEAIKERFTYYHELSHAAYRVYEPGADYMAAIQTMIDNPKSRGVIQMMADYRIIDGVERFRDDPNHTSAVDIVSGMAINAALSMPPGELALLAALSPEDRRRMLSHRAVEFDKVIERYEELHPEKATELARHDRRKQLEEQGKDFHPAVVVRDLLENDCPFQKGTPAYEILELLAAARMRTFENNYREFLPPGGPLKLQLEWGGAVVPAPKSEEPGISPAPANPIKSGR